MKERSSRSQGMDHVAHCLRELPSRGKPVALPTETALEPFFSRQALSYGDVYRWSLTDKERLQWIALGSPVLNALRVFSCGTFVDAQGHRMERKGLPEGILLYCTEGKGYYRQDNDEYEVKPGDLLYCPPLSHHRYWADAETPWTIHWMHLSGDLLPHYEALLGLVERGPLRHIGIHDEIIADFTRLIINPPLSGADASCCFRIQANVITILGDLAALPRNIADITAAYGPVQRAIVLMRASLDQPFSLLRFAREAGYGSRHFFRQFRRVTGLTPGDWFIQQKMHRARELLTLPKIRVKDVALRLGYADPLYFSRLFKRDIGISPEAYREKMNKHLKNNTVPN